MDVNRNFKYVLETLIKMLLVVLEMTVDYLARVSSAKHRTDIIIEITRRMCSVQYENWLMLLRSKEMEINKAPKQDVIRSAAADLAGLINSVQIKKAVYWFVSTPYA